MKNIMPPINTPDNAFHDGNPATGEQGTIVPGAWLNNVQSGVISIQQELLSVLTKAGIEIDETKQDQLVTAITKLITQGIPELPSASLSQKGIVQLSSATNSDSETLAATSKAVKTANDAALKIVNNLSEIAAAGPNAVLAAITNLNLLTTVNNANGALQVTRNLSDLNDTALARTNIGAADANDVVSKKNGGTFDKSIDVKGVVTSREKVECRSPGNDNYSSGFNCYVNDSGVITDYISTHYAIEPQWLFSTELELTTRKVTLSVNGDIKSGGTITAGGEGGARIYRDGNIAGPAWGPIGDLFSYINSIKSGAITSVRLGAQSSADGAIGPIPAGCYLVGTSGSWNIFRPLQFLQNGIWVTAGNI
ncbi:tail fiber protein [Yersinia pseudotuberculosis]|uniref:tail fiber protein n=1 Tax=Yersinia pseudotuberculosis TaxID=633 RepID=UPI00039A9450|nr:phage tail protein [Yersinia pseudotuberculosis]KGA58178.1 phage tail fiber repeat family protein [Yersinia pseudotuberculosis]CND82626.1 tail fiber repeat 2-containing protein [Yersinia pseudotuberculosis]